MNYVTAAVRRSGMRSSETDQVTSGNRFDWAVALLSGWMIGGVHLDAWAHHHVELESFFTPWHGVLYSGFLAVAILLAYTYLRNLQHGIDWRHAMPVGYGLALVGAAIFALGGVGDMIWHTLFGIEVGIEALVSPTHLLLGLGGALIGTGPLRAAWQREDREIRSWAQAFPIVFSLTWLLSILAFFTQYANPLGEVSLTGGRASSQTWQALSVIGIQLQTALILGTIFLSLRRWTLPFGSMTLLFSLYGFLLLSVHERFYLLPSIMLAGVATDLLVGWLLRPTESTGGYRLFAVAVPLVLNVLYFANQAFVDGIEWRVHLWVGAIVMAAIVGWLLSYAFVPPRMG